MYLPTITEVLVFSLFMSLAVVRPTGFYLLDFFCSSIQFYLLLSPYLCFISFLAHLSRRLRGELLVYQ